MNCKKFLAGWNCSMGVACLVLLFGIAGPISTTGAIQAAETPREPVAAEGHDLSLFVGVTQEGSEEAGSIGAEYEYRASGWFGVGGLVDFAFGDVRTGVIGVSALSLFSSV